MGVEVVGDAGEAATGRGRGRRTATATTSAAAHDRGRGCPVIGRRAGKHNLVMRVDDAGDEGAALGVDDGGVVGDLHVLADRLDLAGAGHDGRSLEATRRGQRFDGSVAQYDDWLL